MSDGRRKNITDSWGGLCIPAYTSGLFDALNGYYEEDDNGEDNFIPTGGTHKKESKGVLRRQCTQRWKIAPMRRWFQKHRNGEPIELSLGISQDEWKRMRDSDVKYITNRWPLIEMKMTRHDCKRWLQDHDLEIPVKSSCVFCPYHNQAAWRDLKMTGDGDWTKAVEVDTAIRKARPPYDLFIHPARVPLVDVDLRNMQDRGQLSLWDQECDGICGV